MDGQDEPLLIGRRDAELPDDDAEPLTEEQDEEPSSSPGLFIWLLTLSAGISGLLFGYDTGVISAALVSIDDSLSGRALTSLDKSIIASSTSLLALLASPLSSALADRLGRRSVILLADVLFAAGALIQASSASVTTMVAGRGVVGAAVGAASFAAPLYVSELAPAAHRGRLVTLTVLCITLGQVVAYVVGWALAEHGAPGTGWRWMVGLGAVPALVQLLVVVGAAMPETPRWLVRAGRVADARAVIARVWGGARSSGAGTRLKSGRHVDALLKSIELEVREEAEARKSRRAISRHGSDDDDDTSDWAVAWGELFSVRRNRRALTIACLLQGLQQLCGFNSLMYFSATIFTILGFASPTLTALVVAATNFVFTVAALLVIDRVGRRRVLLWSIPPMIAGLLLAAYGFTLMKELPPTTTTPSVTSSKSAAAIVLISIMTYVAGYAMGLGNVPWMQSELFPLGVRSLGSGLATATNWGANFVVGLTFLPLMDALGPPWTFACYAAVCLGGLVLVRNFYPETAGLSLEEVVGLLDDDGWGVR